MSGIAPATSLGLGDLHHIGVAVRDIDDAHRMFSQLGFVQESQIFDDPGIGVLVQFLTNAGTRVELVQPLSESSPANVWLETGSPIYHFAYAVSSYTDALTQLKSAKFRKIYGPSKAVAFPQREVAFFMNKDRLVIEIIFPAAGVE